MKKLYFSLFFVFLISIYSNINGQTGIQWQRPIGGTGTDTGSPIFKTIDGDIITISQTTSTDGDIPNNHGQNDILVIKMSVDGVIKWSRAYGGSLDETLRSTIYNPDGSLLIFCQTTSSDGDISLNHGGRDIWVLKLDINGNIIWQNSIGGSGNEDFRGGSVLSDGSIAMALVTTSNDGDISGNHGLNDFCLIKLSALGSVTWQHCYGGSNNESTRGLIAMPDGNFIIIGGTTSNDGDITKQQGSEDVWVIKTDNSGNLTWQQTYGGTNYERASTAIRTYDGNIIVSSVTASNNGDVIGNHSYYDNWILKLDYADGSIMWQNSIGGSGDEAPRGILQNRDSSLLISTVTSSTDGDAITNHSSYGNDILFSKLTSGGVSLWNKCFGGSINENVYQVYDDTVAQNYLVVGSSTSPNDGDVTGHHHTFSNNFADTLSDAWLFKMDYSGNLLWQKCLGGTDVDYLFNAAQLNQNEYLLYGYTNSNDGDVQGNHGNGDAWLVKFGPVNTIKGSVFIDNNLNGIKDVNENFVDNVLLTSNKAGYTISSLTVNGIFNNETDSGTYINTPYINLPYYTFAPASRTSIFTNYFNVDSTSFALQPVLGKRDLEISLIPVTAPSPGFASTCKIIYKNVGTDTLTSGTIEFIKDSRQNFVSSIPSFSYQNADTFRLNITNLKPFDTASITIQLQNSAPPTLTINDTVFLKATIFPIAGDLDTVNNISILLERANGSLDPNDKDEIHGGKITTQQVSKSEYLNYIIRFQNTGNSAAYNVLVRDTLDNQLDWNTIQMISSSHPYTISITNGNEILWRFNNINLPDATSNEPGSHGYIAFHVKPKNNLSAGNIINNRASIYFDFNPSVLTNTQQTIVEQPNALPVTLVNFQAHYENKKIITSWRTVAEYNFRLFEIEHSTDGIRFIKIGFVKASGLVTGATYNFEDLNPEKGINYYRLKIIDVDGKFTYSKIVTVKLFEEKISLQLFPNPAHNNLHIETTMEGSEEVTIQIINAAGKKMKSNNIMLNGNTSFDIDIKQLSPGTYFLILRNSSGMQHRRFVKK
ncbi:MAG: T9SS type A sorting domain-containing protein [Ginsengibacter sp.]